MTDRAGRLARGLLSVARPKGAAEARLQAAQRELELAQEAAGLAERWLVLCESWEAAEGPFTASTTAEAQRMVQLAEANVARATDSRDRWADLAARLADLEARG